MMERVKNKQCSNGVEMKLQCNLFTELGMIWPLSDFTKSYCTVSCSCCFYKNGCSHSWTFR